MTKHRPTSAELVSFPSAARVSEPLVAAKVDLRDFPYMPVEVERLFASEFHAQANDSEWRAGVTLWLKSFHQVPAASLPDDDVALARLAELGRDVRAWRRIKKKALRGWVRCGDGRLYHHVVAEKVLEAWIEKLSQRKSGGLGNAKRWGGEFDLSALNRELDEAVRRLKSLNPNSRVLARRIVKEHVARTNPLKEQGATCPSGIAAGVPVGSQGKERESKPYSPVPGDRPLEDETSLEGWPSDAFDQWWSIYPRKDAKKVAHAAFNKLQKRGNILFTNLMAKTLILSNTPKGRNETAKQGQDVRPQPATFLNQERFNDPPETWGAAKNSAQSAENIRGPETFTDAEWLDRVKHFDLDGLWSRLWGPPPGESGCRVPAHLLSAATWKGPGQREPKKPHEDRRNNMRGVKTGSQ
jgi:Protein of unknown function (DUF1376)